METIDGVDTSVLRDLWAARYGDEWVSDEELADADAFYKAALHRFTAEGLVVWLYLLSEDKMVMRLKNKEDSNADS